METTLQDSTRTSVPDQSVRDFYAQLKGTIERSDAIAYRYFDERYSYEELFSRMCKLNSVLSDYDRAQIVVYGTKEFTTYAAIFALFLSNNVWIPLSPDVPVPRNLDILKEVDPKLLLHGGDLPAAISEYARRQNLQTLSFADILSTGTETPFVGRNYGKNDLAYIMFTSGSTGTPKGVPMTHENYINFVRNVLDILPLEKHEVFSDFHDFAFDISIFSLFACVLTESAFSPIIDSKDKVVPVNHIVQNKVTVWSSVPSVINRIRMFRPNAVLETSIRVMFLCGEPLKLDVVRYCLENMDIGLVYNFYGLTETGVENFCHQCHPEDLETYVRWGAVPIGKPLPGNSVRITDDKELWIGGCQVARGYLGGRSPEKFEVADGVRWCKTGDIAEEHEGVFFCKGRMDSQVKLSGHRAELMDIEAHLVMLDEVEDAICFVENQSGRSILVAAIRTCDGEVDFRRIQSLIAAQLPAHMVPKAHVVMDNFPINANGKVDRKKISELYREQLLTQSD